LHVTMVASLAFALVYGVWRRFPRFALALPARSAASLAAALMALAYAALAGFAVPAQRTVYMVFAVALALWLKRAISPSRVLCLALLAVVLIDPWAVLAPGFWLSFGAVAIILYVTAGRLGLSAGGQDLDRIPRFRRNLRLSLLWARVQWSLTLGLIPLTLALFQQVSLVSPIANAVAIPVVSLVVVPLTLLAAIPHLEFLLYPAHAIMLWCFEFLEGLSQLPDAVWQQHAPPGWAIAAGLAGAAWMLAPRGFPARWVGGVALLPLFFAALAIPKSGEVWLTALDVGQGLSVLARTSHHALLYDAGPEFSPGADAGNRIIVPYLRGSGVLRLDGVILTHDDLDHTGGAGSVLEAIPAAWLAASFTPPGDANAMRCFAGQTWEWDGVRFEVLHPSWGSYDKAKIKDNDRGCVLKITSSHGSVLLAADIEARAEAELIARSGDNLQADVLIAPHHGSKSSSSEEFVRRVDPQAVIFSVGYRNRHGHPRPEVVSRYRHSGAAIYRSDQHGAIEIRLGEQPRTETYREKRRRYWMASVE
ncbi:MAG TPA: DNA internalization-related competence protein ComEC/Rec2, partial [Burkholderiales bacterium]|nr:DNA internalization-related competence protein ComEC/Rec2 [Burkholderiales bacterium]